ncbi:unnamed protein product [Protopolystoma xenopodis]|uniref:Uncharacterized protein n=1 Tax=Protopolystoma xenopodis TaxID=117903 RepID=A0A448WJM1_9PLAT|nr:unnamed protein product [Protopolystoma xenopodis]
MARWQKVELSPCLHHPQPPLRIPPPRLEQAELGQGSTAAFFWRQHVLHPEIAMFSSSSEQFYLVRIHA